MSVSLPSAMTNMKGKLESVSLTPVVDNLNVLEPKITNFPGIANISSLASFMRGWVEEPLLPCLNSTIRLVENLDRLVLAVPSVLDAVDGGRELANSTVVSLADMIQEAGSRCPCLAR